MKTLQVIFAFSFLLVSPVAMSKTEVKEKIEQLEQNAENSQKNLKQYEDNLKIVQGNLKQVDIALKELAQQKKDLLVTEVQVKENKKILDAAKVEYQKFIGAEQKSKDEELKRIAELKAALEQLEKNQVKRQQNILAYEAKIGEIEQEKKDWDSHRESVASLGSEINRKEEEAKQEQKRWLAKEASYKAEVKKWNAQAQEADQIRRKYKKLSE